MIDLRLGRYQDTLADVTCDALIVDAPYSARTHGGHDGAPTVGGQRSGIGDPSYEITGYKKTDRTWERRAIDYTGWHPSDVRAFVDFFAPKTRGWMVSITDHVLAPVWAAAMEAHGRYVFAPLPWVAKGSRVRLAGDGPSSWTCQIVVSRPRTGEDRNGRPFSKWGTLPGAYVITQERGIVVGNKPLALMLALVRDYSRPGDTVCDPCAGGGTTLAAAHKLGRDAIGSEMDPETHHKASVRLGLRQPTAEDADWHHRRDQREDKGIEGLPMFSAVDSSKDPNP
jgi:hypothetical protein